MKPYALVLGGGGARGAYQLGVWSVLRSLGIRFHAVFGTSVGALNGAFMVQGGFGRLERLWESIGLDDVVSLPDELKGRDALDLEGVRILMRHRDRILRQGGMDTEPLRRLVRRWIRESRLRLSGKDFGVVTYDLRSMAAKPVFLDTMPRGTLCDYLLASSALPGFKPVEINGRLFIDGGVADNVPVSVALARGYRRLIVVDLSAIGVVKRPDLSGTETVYIRNSSEMGHMLDFRAETKRRNRELGRLDALRAFGRLDGYRYFYREDRVLARRLEKALRSPRVLRRARSLEGFQEAEDAEETLRRNLPERMRHHRFLSVPYLECAALALGVEPVREYSFAGLLRAVKEAFEEKERRCAVEDHESFVRRLSRVDPFDIFDSMREALPACYVVGNPHGLAVRIASRVFPELVPAKIFRLALQEGLPSGGSTFWEALGRI